MVDDAEQWVASVLAAPAEYDEDTVRAARAMDDALADAWWHRGTLDRYARKVEEAKGAKAERDAQLAQARAARGASSRVDARRRVIAELLRKRPSMSAEEVVAALAERGMAVSVATAYRDKAAVKTDSHVAQHWEHKAADVP